MLLALLLMPWLSIMSAPMALASPAAAFSIGRPPLKITVLVGPRNDFCYSDHIDAVEKLALSERERINKAGGIGGRPSTFSSAMTKAMGARRSPS